MKQLILLGLDQIENIKIMIITKIQNKASYQIGVDVLGFPIYLEHQIIIGKTTHNKFNPIKKCWLKVIEKIIKQH